MNVSFLRLALLSDAIFETVCALVFIVAANPLADWTGWHVPGAFTAAGVALVLVALLLYWIAAPRQTNLALARAIMLLNLLFALFGVIALVALWPSLTDGARWMIGLLVLFVGSSGAMEFVGLRISLPNPSDGAR